MIFFNAPTTFIHTHVKICPPPTYTNICIRCLKQEVFKLLDIWLCTFIFHLHKVISNWTLSLLLDLYINMFVILYTWCHWWIYLCELYYFQYISLFETYLNIWVLVVLSFINHYPIRYWSWGRKSSFFKCVFLCITLKITL